MTRLLQLIAPVLLVATPVAVCAQAAVSQPGSANAGPQTETAMPFAPAGASADYRLGAGDVLGISVYRSPEMTSQIMVDTDGTIAFPELGRVKVGGFTVAQVAETLAGRLKGSGILVNPVVNVSVTQLRAKRVSVMGAVGRPGDIPLDRDGITLSQVLALAGANFGTGDAVVTVIAGQGSTAPRDHFRMADLISGRADRPARNGEVIVVQSAPLVYVSGEVGHPGAFPLEPNMTVEQAIAVAGGATTRGSLHRVRITRKQSDGTSQDFVQPQLRTALEPDDIVFVKTRVF